MTVPIRAPRSLGAPATVATATSARHRPSRTTGADRAGRISPADRRDAGGGRVSTVTLQLARVEAARLARSTRVAVHRSDRLLGTVGTHGGRAEGQMFLDRLRIADPLLDDDGDDGAVGVARNARRRRNCSGRWRWGTTADRSATPCRRLGAASWQSWSRSGSSSPSRSTTRSDVGRRIWPTRSRSHGRTSPRSSRARWR